MAELTPEQQLPEASAPARISVVIVSFNRAESLRLSLESLAGAPLQTIVVDNGSADGSPAVVEDFADVRLFRLPKNFGLTKALNIGLRASAGEYILCLHDDTRIGGADVIRLADFLEAHQDAGAVCPLLFNDDGTPANQIRSLPSPADPDPPLAPAPNGEEIRAECVLGAAIMFRSFFLRATRRLDERYGTYGSDVEISMQMRRGGKKIVILGSATAVHEGLASAAPKSALAGDRAAGTAVFLAKHYGFMSGALYRLKTAFGALLTFRFSVLGGALSGQKIDGTG